MQSAEMQGICLKKHAPIFSGQFRFKVVEGLTLNLEPEYLQRKLP